MTIELFKDIETIPVADPELIAMLTEGIKHPANMSKPETIAKWEVEEKPLVIAETIAKTALDGAYGRICCVGYAFGDGDVKTIIDRDEKKIITEFFADVTKHCKDDGHGALLRPTVIGHGVVDFDMKFMRKRAIINGIRPLPLIDWYSKPWGDYVRDTMNMWDSATDKRISLHKLCKVLGVESPKDMHDMTGADVALLWSKRDYKTIAAYCGDDVGQMRLCYRKMTL